MHYWYDIQIAAHSHFTLEVYLDRYILVSIMPRTMEEIYNMLEWMKLNRSWIFSGCGVTLVTTVIGVVAMTQNPASKDADNTKDRKENSPSVSIEGNVEDSIIITSKDSHIDVSKNKTENTLQDTNPPEPTIGHFKTKFGDTTYVIYEDDNGNLQPEQITLMIDMPREEHRHFDHFAVFDITNVAKTDLRIVSLVFRTTKWRPLRDLKYYVPAAGLEPMQAYFVGINKEKRDYVCKLASKDSGNAHILKSGEMDAIKLAFNAQAEGVYDGEINLTYSVNGKVRTMKVGTVKNLSFVDREHAFDIPRGNGEHMEMVRQKILMRPTQE